MNTKCANKPSTFSKAFTLVEILIVVIIVGLLAGIAVMKTADAKERAETNYLKSMISMLDSGIERVIAIEGSFPTIAATTPEGRLSEILDVLVTKDIFVYLEQTQGKPAADSFRTFVLAQQVQGSTLNSLLDANAKARHGLPTGAPFAREILVLPVEGPIVYPERVVLVLNDPLNPNAVFHHKDYWLPKSVADAVASYRNGGFKSNAERQLVLNNMALANLSTSELYDLAKTANSTDFNKYVGQITALIASGEYTDQMDETKAYALLNSMLADNKIAATASATQGSNLIDLTGVDLSKIGASNLGKLVGNRTLSNEQAEYLASEFTRTQSWQSLLNLASNTTLTPEAFGHLLTGMDSMPFASVTPSYSYLAANGANTKAFLDYVTTRSQREALPTNVLANMSYLIGYSASSQNPNGMSTAEINTALQTFLAQPNADVYAGGLGTLFSSNSKANAETATQMLNFALGKPFVQTSLQGVLFNSPARAMTLLDDSQKQALAAKMLEPATFDRNYYYGNVYSNEIYRTPEGAAALKAKYESTLASNQGTKLYSLTSAMLNNTALNPQDTQNMIIDAMLGGKYQYYGSNIGSELANNSALLTQASKDRIFNGLIAAASYPENGTYRDLNSLSAAAGIGFSDAQTSQLVSEAINAAINNGYLNNYVVSSLKLTPTQAQTLLDTITNTEMSGEIRGELLGSTLGNLFNGRSATALSAESKNELFDTYVIPSNQSVVSNLANQYYDLSTEQQQKLAIASFSVSDGSRYSTSYDSSLYSSLPDAVKQSFEQGQIANGFNDSAVRYDGLAYNFSEAGYTGYVDNVASNLVYGSYDGYITTKQTYTPTERASMITLATMQSENDWNNNRAQAAGSVLAAASGLTSEQYLAQFDTIVASASPDVITQAMYNLANQVAWSGYSGYSTDANFQSLNAQRDVITAKVASYYDTNPDAVYNYVGGFAWSTPDDISAVAAAKNIMSIASNPTIASDTAFRDQVSYVLSSYSGNVYKSLSAAQKAQWVSLGLPTVN